MRFIGVIPVFDPIVYKTHFEKSVQRYKMELINVGEDSQNPINNSHIRRLGVGVQYALQNNKIFNDSIVIFAKETSVILDNHFTEKLDHVFSTRPDIGVVGVEGVDAMDRDWKFEYNFGHYIQSVGDDGIGNGNHIVHDGNVGFFDGCVAVSNLMFAVRGSLILSGVVPNVGVFPDDDVVYSYDMCFQCLAKGFGVCVADVLMFDGSRRSVGQNETDGYSKLLDLYESFGNKLPVTNRSFPESSSEVVTIDL